MGAWIAQQSCFKAHPCPLPPVLTFLGAPLYHFRVRGKADSEPGVWGNDSCIIHVSEQMDGRTWCTCFSEPRLSLRFTGTVHTTLAPREGGGLHHVPLLQQELPRRSNNMSTEKLVRAYS